MLVKFFRHGQGGAAGPLNYFLGSDGCRADSRVLYGDPVMTRQLINANPFKQKYKSGVLSFTERADEVTEEQKKDIMQRFEQTLFAGLAPDQYDILWIEHSDKDKTFKTDEDGKIIEGSEMGRLELNFLIPCMELRSGKSLQPFYAGADLLRVDAFKNLINYEYHFSNPDDPLRKREINPYVNNAPRPTPYKAPQRPDPKVHDVFDMKKTEYERLKWVAREEDEAFIKNPTGHQLLKEAIDRQMIRLLEKHQIYDRNTVQHHLRCLGLTVTRGTETSISVSHPNIKKNIRLKGSIYEQYFNRDTALPEMKKAAQERFEAKRDKQYEKDLKTWRVGIEKKEVYHQSLYPAKAPEPLVLEDGVFVSELQTELDTEFDKNEFTMPAPKPKPKPKPKPAPRPRFR